ncbi:hypothetical protein K9M74_00240 [Candidatus Woesearchaeota archaeon]|nr:hypothetical protein [Candidatus Woesearchaeota archaeon]
MKNNKFPTIMVLMSLLLLGMVSAAADISVTTLAENPSNPFYTDVAGMLDIIVENVGNETYTGGTNVLLIDYGNSNTETINLPTLASAETMAVPRTHTYTAAGDYTVLVSYTGGDEDATNDNKTLNLHIIDAVNDISLDSLTHAPTQAIEGQDEITFTLRVNNNGNQHFAGAADAISFDFADGSAVETADMPALAVGESQNIIFEHTYNGAGSYVAQAEYTTNDDDLANNLITTTTSIGAKTYNVNAPQVNINVARGTSDTTVISLTSSGNVPTSATISLTEDLTLTTDGTKTINRGSVSIGPSSFTLNPSSSREVTFGLAQVGLDVALGTYTADYIVTYGPAGAESTTGNLRVVVTNNAPTISAIPDQQVLIGEEFTYPVSATDLETPNNELSYSISGVPGMMINESTGIISWTPTSLYSGMATVSVNDGESTTTTSFSIAARMDAPEISFVVDELNLGGRSASRGTTDGGSLQVKNTGTRTLTNVQVTLTNSYGSDLHEKFNGIVGINKNTLAPGEEATVTVQLTIPEDTDAEQTTVAEIYLSGLDGTTTVTDEATINLEAESELEITDIDIEINNNNDEDDLNDGSTYNDVVEGDKVTLHIELSNKYSSSDDYIRDAYVDVTDDNWDIDETSQEVDIKGNKEATVTVSFTVDEELDDDTTRIFIRAYGEDDRDDEPSFDHYDEWEITIDIERDSNDIRIKDISFERNPVDCNARSVDMDVVLRNYGTSDQDEIFIYAYSDKSELDWNEKKTYLSLNEGEELTRTFRIDLPDNLQEDTYIVNVEVKYDISKDADEELALIEVVCFTNTQTDDEDEDEKDNTATTDEDTDNNNDNVVPLTGNTIVGQPKTGFEKFTESGAYLIVLAVLVFAVLGVSIGLLSVLARK